MFFLYHYVQKGVKIKAKILDTTISLPAAAEPQIVVFRLSFLYRIKEADGLRTTEHILFILVLTKSQPNTFFFFLQMPPAF